MLETHEPGIIKSCKNEVFDIFNEIATIALGIGVLNFDKSKMQKFYENYYVRIKTSFLHEQELYKLTKYYESRQDQ